MTENDKIKENIQNVEFYPDDRSTKLVDKKWKDLSLNNKIHFEYLSTRNEEVELLKGCFIVTESQEIIEVG